MSIENPATTLYRESNGQPLFEQENPGVIQYRELPTFTVLAQGVAPGNNKSMLAIRNTSANLLVRIHSIHLVNVQNTSITGVVGTFQINRATGLSSGTTLSVQDLDTADVVSGAVTVTTNSTITGESSPPIWKAVFSTDDWGMGTLDVEAYNQVFQTLFPIWKKPDDLTRYLTVRQNEVISVKFATNSNVSSFDIMMVFSQETI